MGLASVALTGALRDIALRAAREILDVYGSDFAVTDKADATPVTEADTRAERVILDGLASCAPDIAVVAEESAAAGRVPEVRGRPFFLVDPLDGTREFISRNDEFTVNIALIEYGSPTAGVIHVPALDETYWTAGDGTAWRSLGGGAQARIACRRPGDRGLVVVASRSHRNAATRAYLERCEAAEVVSAGSSLKLCRVAEGAADLYPPARPHDGVGHRGRPRNRRGGRRKCRDLRRPAARLRQARIRESPLRSTRAAAQW